MPLFSKSRVPRNSKTNQRRTRRLFLEPLEDRRLLTFGWGSNSASGSTTGMWTSGTYPYSADVQWPTSDSDGDGVNDDNWIGITAYLTDSPWNTPHFTEGESIMLRLQGSVESEMDPQYVSAECWIEDVSTTWGADYADSLNPLTTTWPCGSGGGAGQSQEYFIDAIDDSEVELTELARIHIHEPGNPSNEAVVEFNILDNDGGGIVYFSAQTTAAAEGNDIVLSVTSDSPLPFEYRVENVSAIGGVDYSGPSEWTNLDGSGLASFPTYADSDNEGTESFKVLVRVVDQPSTEMVLEADIFDNDEPNAVPVAANDSLTTGEDTPLTVNAPGILGNDTDANGDSLIAYFASGPANGTLSLSTSGSFTYTPNANYFGGDQFTYRASDGPSFSNVATVAINVTAVNNAPVAANNTYSMAGNTTLSPAAPGVVGNDSDIDGDTLTAALVTGPASGSLTLNANGSFVFTPATGFAGTVTFTYRASDSQTTSNLATVTITVVGTSPPVAVADGYEVYKNSPPNVFAAPGILANDADPDGDPLTAVLVSGAAHGSLVLSGNGSFMYTPATGYLGYDSFTYRATDGHATSNTATVTIGVVQPLDISTGGFYADGTNLKLDYRVVGTIPTGYSITVYQSPDGVTPGQALQSAPGNTTPGIHTLTLAPTFTDPAGDYYLLAKVDSGDIIPEQHEWNNAALFAGGAFIATETGGQKVLHVHGGNDSDVLEFERYSDTVFQLTAMGYSIQYAMAVADVIRIRAHGGNDMAAVDRLLQMRAWMYGGEGDDYLSGGAGDDYLSGGGGNDQLSGNAGNDGLFGADGDDSLFGGLGNDNLGGDAGEDNLYGGDGADTLFGGNDDDTLSGGAGADDLQGGSGSDDLYGDGDDDTLAGDAGDDELRGGDGDDTLGGGDGNDTLGGDAGNDHLDGDQGDDGLYGGPGNDDLGGDGDGNNSSSPDGSPPGGETAPIEVVYCDINESASEGSEEFIEVCSFSEGPGSAEVTVTLTPGTATYGADYGGPTSITVTVEAGPTAGSVLIRVPIYYDHEFDPGETFSYTITNVVGGFTRATEPMTVTIGDATMQAVDDVAKTSMDVAVEIRVRENDYWRTKGASGHGSYYDPDPHAPILSFTEPAHGTVGHIYVNNHHMFLDLEPVYTPDPGFYGDDEFHYTISYEHISDYDVNYGDCTGCSETAHVFVNVRKIDLDNDTDGDGSITDADEPLEPGQVPITINLDDDNANGTPDWEETGSVSGEDDLEPFNITAALSAARPELYAGSKLVLYMPDEPYGRVWTTADKTERIVGEYFPPSMGYGFGKVWTIGEDEIPTTLYVEAGPLGFSGPGGTLELNLGFGRVIHGVGMENLIRFGEFAIDLEVGEVGEQLEDDPGVILPYDVGDPVPVEGSISVRTTLSGNPSGTLTWQIPSFLSVRWETSEDVWEEVQTGVPYPYNAGETRSIAVTGDAEGIGNLAAQFAQQSTTQTDQAKISVRPLSLDLDIDSNNDGVIDETDDPVEDIAGDDSNPGKVILVSNFDTDDDGLLDWADGFDWMNGVSADNYSAGTTFTPLELKLPNGLDYGTLNIELEYNDSNPDDFRTNSYPGREFVRPTDGALRIWTKIGSAARNPRSIGDGGDFIPAGTYTAAELGINSTTAAFFVEAINPSQSTADQQITVRVSGGGLRSGLVLTDQVRATATMIEIYASLEEDGSDPVEADGFSGSRLPQYDNGNNGALFNDDRRFYTVHIFDPRVNYNQVTIAGESIPLVAAGSNERVTSQPIIFIRDLEQPIFDIDALVEFKTEVTDGNGDPLPDAVTYSQRPSDITGTARVITIGDGVRPVIQFVGAEQPGVSIVFSELAEGADKTIVDVVSRAIAELGPTWTAANPTDSGAYGKAVHAKVREMMGQFWNWPFGEAERWKTGMLIEIGTGRIEQLSGATQGTAEYVELDAVYLKPGYNPQRNAIIDPNKIILYEIKTSASGQVDVEQLAKLRQVQGGEIRQIWSELKWLQSTNELVENIRYKKLLNLKLNTKQKIALAGAAGVFVLLTTADFAFANLEEQVIKLGDYKISGKSDGEIKTQETSVLVAFKDLLDAMTGGTSDEATGIMLLKHVYKRWLPALGYPPIP